MGILARCPYNVGQTMTGIEMLLKPMLKAMGFDPESFLKGIAEMQAFVFDNIDDLKASRDRLQEQLDRIEAKIDAIAGSGVITDHHPNRLAFDTDAANLPGNSGVQPDTGNPVNCQLDGNPGSNH